MTFTLVTVVGGLVGDMGDATRDCASKFPERIFVNFLILYTGYFRCDEGWQGPECKIPSELLPFELKDNFEQESKNQFPTVVGGERSTSWGDLAFGHSLHFNQVKSRVLIYYYHLKQCFWSCLR